MAACPAVTVITKLAPLSDVLPGAPAQTVRAAIDVSIAASRDALRWRACRCCCCIAPTI
jgi:hypothetical protein